MTIAIFLQDKVIVLHRDNADQICPVQNVYVKSSHRGKMNYLVAKNAEKYVPLKYSQKQYLREQNVVLNVDNADKICATENVYVKSSYQNKIIIFKPKM